MQITLDSFIKPELGIKRLVKAWKARTDISETEYRTSKGLSQSELNKFIVSPMSYLDSLKYPKKPTADMEFGTCFHAMLLDENPEETFVEMPDFGDKRNPKNKEDALRWEHENAGKIHLDSKAKEGQQTDLQRLTNMKNACQRHEPLLWAFGEHNDIIKEQVLYAEIETDNGNILLKGRLDLYSKKLKRILDYKTTDDASEAFIRTINTNGYDIQAVQYIFLCLANDMPVDEYHLAAVEKKAKSDTSGSHFCEIGCYSIDITKTKKWKQTTPIQNWAKALNDFCVCSSNDIWPSYNGNKVVEVEL